jgi:molybdopterin converting factor small subunit
MTLASIRLDERLLAAPLPAGLVYERINRHEIVLQVPTGLSVNQVLEGYNISLSQGVAGILYGQTVDLTHPLGENDEVRLLPQIAGGD